MTAQILTDISTELCRYYKVRILSLGDQHIGGELRPMSGLP